MVLALVFNAIEKEMVFLIRPRVKEGKEDLAIGSDGMLESPLDPSLVVLLNNSFLTILATSTLWATLFHYVLVYSL